jgi:predicted RND superfamily exporter protein
MGFGISLLKMEMTFYSILPNHSHQVRDMKMILEEFPAASSILAVVDARHIVDPLEAEKKVKEAVDSIVRRLSGEEFSDYVVRVTGKTDINAFKEHGLMFSREKDIRRIARIYGNLNLVPLLTAVNDDFELEYTGDDKNLADEEQMAAGMFRGLNEVLAILEKAAGGQSVGESEIDKALDSWLFGETYILSHNNKMAIAIIQPTFTMEDFLVMTPAVNAIEKAVKDLGEEMGLHVGITGMVVIGRDEMVTSEQGILFSSLIALLTILFIMVFVFRMFSVPFISGIPLVTGILWTMGMSGFIIHRLNIMTAMYLVALLGLGIDFAIHLLTAFIQERDDGLPFTRSIRNAVQKSGSPIVTGGLTSATAFFALIIADTEMIRELGFVAGMGILSELIAMILFIPPLLGFREYRLNKKGKGENRIFSKVQIKSDAASGIGKVLVKAPVTFSIIMLAVGLYFAVHAPGISLETNLMKMEAEGLESIFLQDLLVDEFGMAPDSLSIISMDPAEVRDLSDKLDDLSSVKMVESLGSYYVSPEETLTRGDLLRRFSDDLKTFPMTDFVDNKLLLEQLYRLEMNFMEMGDLAYMGNLDKILHTIGWVTGYNDEGLKVWESSFDRLYDRFESENDNGVSLLDLQQQLVPILKNKLLSMANDTPVNFEVLPENLRDSYISRDGTKYLLNVIPTQNPWVEDFRKIYKQQMSSVTDKGTGMLLAGDQLTHMAEVDGVRAAIIAVIAVFIILLMDFRNIKLVFLTMITLLLSFMTLFGIMAVTGIKFDFMNIIVVPLLIGIGVDDAVHINHRYLYEGKGKMKFVIGKTGTALLITSLTTIVGFASFIPSVMRAMRSTGIVLSLAMALAFLFSVFFHPGLLIIVCEKWRWNLRPWGGNE